MTININNYFEDAYKAVKTISTSQLNLATQILEQVHQNQQTTYVIGNGQSAASASAFALDLSLHTGIHSSKRRFRIISLTDNNAAITAWANDVNYESIFTEQLKSLWNPGDVLLAVSASGSSPNIIQACSWVNENEGQIIGLTGFKGGSLCALSQACIVVDSSDYGYIETAHVAVMHYWVAYFKQKLVG